jgi:amino acid transporter
MVFIKLFVILLVLIVGAFYVDVKNWKPFAPESIGGVLKGVSAVFFAYIGFDAISTTAEECKNPKRDLPRAMMWSIIICTIVYILIALVLTGMVDYKLLNVGDPLSFVFEKLQVTWIAGIIAVSAVVAMASVLLVFQMGQPRIWMSMSRDGLLPKRFSKIHPKYKTPSFATIVVGFVVAIPALFMNLKMVTDLCSIGTLFAFVLVCGGVLVMQARNDSPKGTFKTPYFNSKYVMPFIVLLIGLMIYSYGLTAVSVSQWVFIVVTLLFSLLAFKYNFSTIPLLGLLSCFYMMTELDVSNWIGFGVWLLIGLGVYFGYSRKRSLLGKKN